MSEALDAYLGGSLEKAISLQRRIVAANDPKKRPNARDFLLLGMFLDADKRVADAISVLQDGLRLYPDSAELRENLGVCHLAKDDFLAGTNELERALALGSNSTNVLDSLCRALPSLGRSEEAIAYGRKSLQLKDGKFGTRHAFGKIPDAAPAPFNPLIRSENVISYALWGADPRYLMPLQENLRIRMHLFPAWTVRVYLDSSVPEEYRLNLQQDGVQICLKEQARSEPASRKLLWRFEVISDPNVKRFLVRDADSLLSVKERVAVDAWLNSGKYFHVMRDFYTHTDLVLAGLWGGVTGILPPLQTLVDKFKPWRIENAHIDQDLLAVTAWSTIRRSCLIHDSVFTGCLGSVPFPPYGDLPKGHHIGQNAFIHFKRTR